MTVNEIHISDDSFELYDEEYSNAVDPISAVAEGVGKISETIGKAIESVPLVKKELKFRCGRRPLRQKKRQSSGYNDCRSRFYEEISQDKALQLKLLNRELDIKSMAIRSAQTEGEREKSKYSPKKVVGYTLLGVGAILVTYVVVKMVK